MRKKERKPLPLFENVEIIDTSAEGKSVGKVDDFVIFVSNAVPGDIVNIQTTFKKKNYAEGRAVVFHKKSELRTETRCEHFGICGGCKWQHMDYAAQLNFKYKQVSDSMQRLAKIENVEIAPVKGSAEQYYYRNKLEYTFSNKRWLTNEDMPLADSGTLQMNALGFHIPQKFDKILDIENCYLQASPSNDIRNFVKEYALKNNLTFFDIKNQNGLLRNLIIRTSNTGEVMVIVSFYERLETEINALLTALKNNFSQITSLLFVINGKKNDTISDLTIENFFGKNFIEESMEGLTFRVSPISFYQTNSAQAYELYKITRDFANLTGNELVYDLYTGTGTIANFVAKKAKKVIGIEYIPQAIEDAKVNSSINNINNTDFFAGDMKDVLNTEFVAKHGKPDVIISDPPRAGMHEDVVKKIIEIAPQKIVYVSCNPATQARDLILLKEFYDVVKIQPVDMFPQTHHIENVVLLQLKK